MGAPAWFTNVLCPTIALIITNCMWLTPLNSILSARRTRDLGTLNPLPFAFMVLNCTGWLIYSLMKGDLFVYWSNVTGLWLGLFYCINSLVLSASAQHLRDHYLATEFLFMFSFVFWALVSLVATCALDHPSASTQKTFEQAVVGSTVLIFNILYYASPLSTITNVIKTRNSSSMSPALILVNLFNGVMWTIYGSAIADVNILIPNCLGSVLATVQLVVLVKYHNGRPTSDSSNSAVEEMLSGVGQYEPREFIITDKLNPDTEDTISRSPTSFSTVIV